MLSSGMVTEISVGTHGGPLARYSGIVAQDVKRNRFSFCSGTYHLTEINADGLPSFNEADTFPVRIPRVGERLVFSYNPEELDPDYPYLEVNVVCWDFELAYRIQLESLPSLRLVRWTCVKAGPQVRNVILANLWAGENPLNESVEEIIKRHSKFKSDSEYPPPRLAFISFSGRTHRWVEQPWPVGLTRL